uniref:Uncharacterized protein n=1 Tax=Kalanchoe fedtschenkoi TaxID=63787 RepID=A0A7N0UUJ2_KALFE
MAATDEEQFDLNSYPYPTSSPSNSNNCSLQPYVDSNNFEFEGRSNDNGNQETISANDPQHVFSNTGVIFIPECDPLMGQTSTVCKKGLFFTRNMRVFVDSK